MIKLWSLTVVASILLLAALAGAQEKLSPRGVRVVGTAEVKTPPDEVIIQFGVEKQSGSAITAKRLADDAARSALAELKKNGIDDKDTQTTMLMLQPESNYVKGRRISYFVAGQNIRVTVHDLSRVETLLESLIRAGSNKIDAIYYEVSDLRKYRDQARELAVKAAREKAQALAKVLGQDVGKAYSIDEPEYGYEYSAGLMANTEYEHAKAPAKSGPSTAPGEHTISASIVVVFDLN